MMDSWLLSQDCRVYCTSERPHLITGLFTVWRCQVPTLHQGPRRAITIACIYRCIPQCSAQSLHVPMWQTGVVADLDKTRDLWSHEVGLCIGALDTDCLDRDKCYILSLVKPERSSHHHRINIERPTARSMDEIAVFVDGAYTYTL